MSVVDLTSITPEPAALKALAHPVRLRILGLLRSEGPATATSLAQRLGLNSGAMSYHLRQLHQHGFITDDPERGNARERWWRAAHQATRASKDNDQTAEGRAALDALTQAVAVVHTEQLQRSLEEAPTLPSSWRRATTHSDWQLRVSPARAEQLTKALADLVEGWAEDDEATDGEDFVVQVHAFPRPGTLAPSGSHAEDEEQS